MDDKPKAPDMRQSLLETHISECIGLARQIAGRLENPKTKLDITAAAKLRNKLEEANDLI